MIKPTLVEFIHISPVLHEKIKNADKKTFWYVVDQYLLLPKNIIIRGIDKTISPQMVVTVAAFSGSTKLARKPTIRDMST
jgi:hypothetical protein